ncbi:MAG TPA: helix-turn-helix domain-containing protein [Stellaceae bacterium]|nr:helix-turn-helix domain-containing protein [Stellaceae bacterium]
METKQALTALGALAQETRLDIFRLLVQRGLEGLAAGAIADRLGVPGATLSFHLQQLMHARLIEQRRESRSLIERDHAKSGWPRRIAPSIDAGCHSERIFSIFPEI